MSDSNSQSNFVSTFLVVIIMIILMAMIAVVGFIVLGFIYFILLKLEAPVLKRVTEKPIYNEMTGVEYERIFDAYVV